MTSDAKIGLILGLVFIFIIAFIINGLPKIHGEKDDSDPTTNLVGLRNQQVGIGSKERRASESYKMSERQGEGPSEKAKGPAAVRRTSSAEKSDVRHEELLPGYASAVRHNISGDAVSMDVAKGMGPLRTSDTRGPGPGPVGDRKGTPSKPGTADNKTENAAAADNKVEKPATADTKVEKPRIYTVVDGDNLSVIAKKCYGSEEGNRWVNVTRIFEANRQILKAPDEVFIGQKLTIPPLPALGSGKGKPSEVLSGSQFEKVESVVGKGPTAGGKPAGAGRYYVVQDGDSLWKIASKELGKASRYAEIAKLNTDILSDEDELSIGMRLKMPGQN